MLFLFLIKNSFSSTPQPGNINSIWIAGAAPPAADINVIPDPNNFNESNVIGVLSQLVMVKFANQNLAVLIGGMNFFGIPTNMVWAIDSFEQNKIRAKVIRQENLTEVNTYASLSYSSLNKFKRRARFYGWEVSSTEVQFVDGDDTAGFFYDDAFILNITSGLLKYTRNDTFANKFNIGPLHSFDRSTTHTNSYTRTYSKLNSQFVFAFGGNVVSEDHLSFLGRSSYAFIFSIETSLYARVGGGIGGLDNDAVSSGIGVYSSSNTPGCRYGHSAWVIGITIYIYSGWTGADGGHSTNDLWGARVNTETLIAEFASLNNYTDLHLPNYTIINQFDPTNTPGNRCQPSTTVLSEESGIVVLCGGPSLTGINDYVTNMDYWIYSATLNQWKYLGGNFTVDFSDPLVNGVYGVKKVFSPYVVTSGRQDAMIFAINESAITLFGGANEVSGDFMNVGFYKCGDYYGIDITNVCNGTGECMEDGCNYPTPPIPPTPETNTTTTTIIPVETALAAFPRIFFISYGVVVGVVGTFGLTSIILFILLG